MTKQELQQEALTRAVAGITASNYPAIYVGFAALGIAEEDIRPRENVFTFNAWKALGRHVKRGEHGIRVATVRDCVRKERDEQTGQEQDKHYSIPWSATVFHVSQTEPDST